MASPGVTPTQKPATLREKWWSFTEHPLAGLGAGIMLGAVATVLPLGWVFVIAGIPIAIAIFRARFFESASVSLRLLGNLLLCGLLAVVLFAVSKIVPHPREPPSAEEIAQAVKKEMEKKEPVNTGTPAAEFTPAPTATPSRNATPEPAATLPVAKATPFLKAVLTTTQKSLVSTRADAPIETEVTIQTTQEMLALKLIMKCDRTLTDVTINDIRGGMRTGIRSGIVPEQPSIYLYSYETAAPPFGPSNPLIFNVWSKDAITCSAATF